MPVDLDPTLAMAHIVETLGRRSQPFALVGGLAVSVRAEVRFTRDVDIAVAVDGDEQAEQLLFVLRDAAYIVHKTIEHDLLNRLSTARLLSPSKIVVDLLFAASGIEREVVERATVVDIPRVGEVPVARAEELVAMKLLSAKKARPHDQVDISALLQFNPDIDRDAVRENLRLIEERGYGRDLDLNARFEDALATYLPGPGGGGS